MPGGRLVVNLDGPIISGIFAGQALGNETLRGRFLALPQVGFTPLHGHPASSQLIPNQAGVGSFDDMPAANVPAAVAEGLIDDDDALAFLQFAVAIRRSRQEIIGPGERRRGVSYRRGDAICWIFAGGPPGGGRPGYGGGDESLLSEVVGAHARWASLGSPRMTDLEIEIGKARTRVFAGGRLACSTPLFSPVAVLPARP
jgi:hypothetical protein